MSPMGMGGGFSKAGSDEDRPEEIPEWLQINASTARTAYWVAGAFGLGFLAGAALEKWL